MEKMDLDLEFTKTLICFPNRYSHHQIERITSDNGITNKFLRHVRDRQRQLITAYKTQTQYIAWSFEYILLYIGIYMLYSRNEIYGFTQ